LLKIQDDPHYLWFGENLDFFQFFLFFIFVNYFYSNFLIFS